jgi:hypothetical protein
MKRDEVGANKVPGKEAAVLEELLAQGRAVDPGTGKQRENHRRRLWQQPRRHDEPTKTRRLATKRAEA